MSHIKNLQAAMKENNTEAILISSEINQRYLSNFAYTDGFMLILPDEALLLTDFRYVEAAKESADEGMQVLTPEKGATDAICTILGEHNCARVAIEEDNISYATYERYRKTFVGSTLEGGASALLTRLRLHKSDEELEKIARAQSVTDAAFAHILKVLTPEMTEIDVALELEMFMRRAGAQSLAFDTIAVSGTNSSRPHGVPRPVKLERGFLTMDFGARVDGYCSDMTRTVVLGKADEEIKKVYNTVLLAQTVALEAAAEGVSCHALDTAARNVIHGAGYKGCFGHSLGHGVGMYIHEEPRLSPKADNADVLERGHVVTFEPGIYIEGKYGCRIEDMIGIKADGTVMTFVVDGRQSHTVGTTLREMAAIMYAAGEVI